MKNMEAQMDTGNLVLDHLSNPQSVEATLQLSNRLFEREKYQEAMEMADIALTTTRPGDFLRYHNEYRRLVEIYLAKRPLKALKLAELMKLDDLELLKKIHIQLNFIRRAIKGEFCESAVREALVNMGLLVTPHEGNKHYDVYCDVTDIEGDGQIIWVRSDEDLMDLSSTKLESLAMSHAIVTSTGRLRAKILSLLPFYSEANVVYIPETPIKDGVPTSSRENIALLTGDITEFNPAMDGVLVLRSEHANERRAILARARYYIHASRQSSFEDMEDVIFAQAMGVSVFASATNLMSEYVRHGRLYKSGYGQLAVMAASLAADVSKPVEIQSADIQTARKYFSASYGAEMWGQLFSDLFF